MTAPHRAPHEGAETLTNEDAVTNTGTGAETPLENMTYILASSLGVEATAREYVEKVDALLPGERKAILDALMRSFCPGTGLTIQSCHCWNHGGRER